MKAFNEVDERLANLSIEDDKITEDESYVAKMNGNFYLLDDLSRRIDFSPAQMPIMW